MKLHRYEKNPIIKPDPASEWESLVTTNPGAWYDEQRKEVIMLYRAAGNDIQHVIHLGLAASKNGFDFHRASDKPAVSPVAGTSEGGCFEDPRIVKIGEW